MHQQNKKIPALFSCWLIQGIIWFLTEIILSLGLNNVPLCTCILKIWTRMIWILDKTDVRVLTPTGSACQEAVPTRQGCLMFSLVLFKFSKPRASHLGQCHPTLLNACSLIPSIFYLNICLLSLLVFIIVFILITIWHLLYD